jgi:hypothetical protein
MQQHTDRYQPQPLDGFPPTGFDLLAPPVPMSPGKTYWLARSVEWSTGASGVVIYDFLGDAVFLPDTVATQVDSVLSRVLLSVYQRRAIFRAMLRKAHMLARSGAQRQEIRQQVIHLRDALVQAALTDFAIRCRRGHLR